MVKINIKRKAIKSRKAAPRVVPRPTMPRFGPVSSIATAPVAIGNSLTGFKTVTVPTKEGMSVVGRDFAYTVSSTGSVTNWCLAGGCPTTPAAFSSGVLQNCGRMYNRYKPRKLTFHYITASATSQTGDVLFYLRKNEGSTMPNNTSTTFLNYVLSDSNTVIGPQWTNHTATFDTNNCPWMSTDYGATEALSTYNQYDLFLYSKTASANSPGYVIIDYVFEFKEIALNPRAGNLAEIAGSKAMWNPFAATFAMVATGSSTTIVSAQGTTGVGGTTITALPTNNGDVWEVILDVTNSTFDTTVAGTFARAVLTAGATITGAAILQTITLTDGMVMYFVDNGANTTWYATRAAAFACTSPLIAAASVTYAETLRGLARCVGSTRPIDLAYSQ